MTETVVALAVAVALGGSASRAAAQPSPGPAAMAAMGTYALGTRHLASSHADGCWLEAAPIQADSMHLQLLCRKPAPGQHLGVLDARLRLRGNILVYERGDAASRCRITVRFAGRHGVVAQDGTDIACGFGAFVDVSGAYARLSTRRPRFDLAPIDRARPRG
jgi:hypothetical protein